MLGYNRPFMYCWKGKRKGNNMCMITNDIFFSHCEKYFKLYNGLKFCHCNKRVWWWILEKDLSQYELQNLEILSNSITKSKFPSVSMRPENHLMLFFLEKLELTEDSVGAKEEIDVIKAINLLLIQWTFQLLITNLRMKWKYSKLSVNERYATFSWNHSRFLAKHKAIWCE